MFPSKSFIVSGLTFRSLIHFEFIFVYSLRRVLISFFYMYLSSFPSTIYWRDFYPLTSLVSQMVKCLPTMQETRVWSLGGEDPLEKEMATHSSTLAWKIPWTEVPGRLQSMGLQRVRHDWVTSLSFSLVPLHILASFVKNKVPIGAWVYFLAFYLVLLVYISVFVPVPYCLGDCSFVA